MFLPCLKRKGTAYFEFQYCKHDWNINKLLKKGYTFWEQDSLLVNVDDDERFFSEYSEYLKAPDGQEEFDPFGVNYYTKEHAYEILEIIKADKPADWKVLAEWLAKAVSENNGFFFLGI